MSEESSSLATFGWIVAIFFAPLLVLGLLSMVFPAGWGGFAILYGLYDLLLLVIIVFLALVMTLLRMWIREFEREVKSIGPVKRFLFHNIIRDYTSNPEPLTLRAKLGFAGVMLIVVASYVVASSQLLRYANASFGGFAAHHTGYFDWLLFGTYAQLNNVTYGALQIFGSYTDIQPVTPLAHVLVVIYVVVLIAVIVGILFDLYTFMRSGR